MSLTSLLIVIVSSSLAFFVSSPFLCERAIKHAHSPMAGKVRMVSTATATADIAMAARGGGEGREGEGRSGEERGGEERGSRGEGRRGGAEGREGEGRSGEGRGGEEWGGKGRGGEGG